MRSGVEGKEEEDYEKRNRRIPWNPLVVVLL
jgi:hypothetical protein